MLDFKYYCSSKHHDLWLTRSNVMVKQILVQIQLRFAALNHNTIHQWFSLEIYTRHFVNQTESFSLVFIWRRSWYTNEEEFL